MAPKLKFYLCFIAAGLILTACSNGIIRFYNNSPLRLSYTTNTSRVNGIVLDQNGKPVANAQIRVRAAYQSVKAQTDLDGRFSLLLTIQGDSLRLTVNAKNYASIDYNSISRWELINSDWQFRLTDNSSKSPAADSTRCIIRGMVIDSTGEPIPGASIRLSGTKIGAAASIDGQFLIKDIPPGNYEFLCYSIGFGMKHINIFNIAPGSIDTLLIILKSRSLRVSDINLDGPPPFDRYIANNCWEIKSEKLSQRSAKTVNQALKACPGISR